MKQSHLVAYTLTLLLSFSIVAYANPNFVITAGMHMDKQGKLIPPDKIYLSYAFEAYQKGYNQSAYSYFKKASALGNTVAQKYVGLMHLKALGVEQDWAKGYAWIKLSATDNNSEHKALEQEIYKSLSIAEKSRIKQEYALITEDYGQIAALTRRDRWVAKQKMKMTGSRTGSLAFAPLSFSSPRGNGFYDGLKSFVDDFNYGYVTSGEIIPKEETQHSGEK